MLAKSSHLKLELETLEDRNLLAGVVEVDVVDGLLTLTGDDAGNQVFVTQLTNGQYFILGIGTQVTLVGEDNGGTQTGIFQVIVDAEAVESIDVDLGNGSDTFIGYEFNVVADLNIDTGDGFDTVALGNINVGDNIFIATGNDNDNVLLVNTFSTNANTEIDLGTGSNVALLSDVDTGGDLTILGGEEIVDTDPDFDLELTNSDVVLGLGLEVDGNLSVTTQDGTDLVALIGTYLGNVNVDLGSELDVVAFGGTADGDVTLAGGTGTDISILLDGLEISGVLDLIDFEFEFDLSNAPAP